MGVVGARCDGHHLSTHLCRTVADVGFLVGTRTCALEAAGISQEPSAVVFAVCFLPEFSPEDGAGGIYLDDPIFCQSRRMDYAGQVVVDHGTVELDILKDDVGGRGKKVGGKNGGRNSKGGEMNPINPRREQGNPGYGQGYGPGPGRGIGRGLGPAPGPGRGFGRGVNPPPPGPGRGLGRNTGPCRDGGPGYGQGGGRGLGRGRLGNR